MALVLGAWIWVRPPRTFGGKGFELAGIAWLASWAVAFLPAPAPLRGAWWPEAFQWGLDQPLRPIWWRRAREDITGLGLDIDIPPMLSLQPWITWESLLPWVAAGAVLYGIGTLAFTPAQRSRLLAATIAFGVVAALASLALRFPGVPGPVPGAGAWAFAALAVVGAAAVGRPGANEPFPVPVALALGSVPVALGAAWVAGGALPALAGAAGCVACALAGRLPLATRLLVVFCAALAVGLAARVLGDVPPGRAPAAASLALFADQPLLGVGWGNHAALVPQAIDLAALPAATTSAPRPALAGADWLRFAAEGGLLGLGAAGAWAWFSVVRLRRVAEAEDPGVRFPLAAGLACLAAGTFVDSPLGTPGGLALGAWLFGLARPLRRPGNALGLTPLVWRGVGAVVLAIGLLYVMAGAFRLPVHSTTVAEARPADLHPDRNPPWPLSRWDEHMREVGMRPLDGRAYFERARTRAATGKNLRLLPIDAGRAQFLMRDDPWVSLWLGVALLQRSRAEAVVTLHRAFTHPAADRVAMAAALRRWTDEDPRLGRAVDVLARGGGLVEARALATGEGSP